MRNRVVKEKSVKHRFSLSNWEFWPMWLANIPVVLFAIYFGIRARNLLFFTATNPAIPTGGLFGESKMDILKQIPEKYLPKTIFIPVGSSEKWIKTAIEKAEIDYPLILKPDVGERGLLVTKIKSEDHLFQILNKYHIPFLIQEFIDYKEEWAVMHHRFPGKSQGAVTSICVKKTLQIIGDGKHTVGELMQQSTRANLQYARFQKEQPALLQNIPEIGVSIELEPIGNHSRGTTFLNGNHHIDPSLTAVFDKISNQFDGIYYGRFDLKCKSAAHLRKGDFTILEYNGVGAEPAHIYDSSIPVKEKYRSIYRHWKIMYEIFKVQKRQGAKPERWSVFRSNWKTYSGYMKNIER